jgi:hypothetical protein
MSSIEPSSAAARTVAASIGVLRPSAIVESGSAERMIQASSLPRA